MRRSEILALQWRDIDFLLGQVYINRSFHVLKGGKIHFSPTKTAVRARNQAMTCYASQSRSGPPQRNLLFLLRRFLGQRDSFMRAYPPDKGGREHDLFENVS